MDWRGSADSKPALYAVQPPVEPAALFVKLLDSAFKVDDALQNPGISLGQKRRRCAKDRVQGIRVNGNIVNKKRSFHFVKSSTILR
jgi:hypothetical protein